MSTRWSGARDAALLAGATGLLVHAGPALGAIGPVRRRVLPAYSGFGDPDHVALTFDDGPARASTPLFLEALARAGVRATFFVLGSSLARDPGLGREVAAAGHELAVHGWEHRLLTLRGPRAVAEDLRRARDLVGDLAGRAPRWFRPPYGVATTAALRSAGRLDLTPVLWTAWGRDWTRRATARSIATAVGRVRPEGGTILLHEVDTCSAPGSWRATLDALPDLLGRWHGAGLRVGPLGEHRRSINTPIAPPGSAGRRTRRGRPQ